MLRRFSQQHRVTLVSFVRPDDRPEYVAHLRGIAHAVSTVPIRRSLGRNLRAGIKGLLTGLSIVIARAEMAEMAATLRRLTAETAFDPASPPSPPRRAQCHLPADGYEWQTSDRALTAAEQAAVVKLTSPIDVTSTRAGVGTTGVTSNTTPSKYWRATSTRSCISPTGAASGWRSSFPRGRWTRRRYSHIRNYHTER